MSQLRSSELMASLGGLTQKFDFLTRYGCVTAAASGQYFLLASMDLDTVTLDDQTAEWARAHAAERGMSLSRYIGEVLRQQLSVIRRSTTPKRAGARLGGARFCVDLSGPHHWR